MGVPLTYVFTHDSIGVGEDGPTHEPIEQLAALRAMPNFHVFRPCDAMEHRLPGTAQLHQSILLQPLCSPDRIWSQ